MSDLRDAAKRVLARWQQSKAENGIAVELTVPDTVQLARNYLAIADLITPEVREASERFKQHPVGLYTEIAYDLRGLSSFALSVIKKLEDG